MRTHFARHSHLVLPPLSPNSRWLSALLAPPPLRQPLPLYFSPHPPSLARSLPPSIPPPTPSFHLWQLLIHVTALQMSQLTSWENSRGGEDRRRLERRERGGESATTTATTALHLRRGKAPPPNPGDALRSITRLNRPVQSLHFGHDGIPNFFPAEPAPLGRRSRVRPTSCSGR